MGADKPLCRLCCRNDAAGQTWRWESLDCAVTSGVTFSTIYECTQHAKAKGYVVDLAAVGIVEDHEAPVKKPRASRKGAPVRAATKQR